MVTSFENFKIQWKLVSTKSEAYCVTSEYECELPSECSDSRKFHMTRVVSPQRESISLSII